MGTGALPNGPKLPRPSSTLPQRRFAAVQRYGRYRWNTGRSVDTADTAVPDPKRSSLWLSICAATCATIGSNPLQKTRCGYFRAEETLPCNKRKPGSGCSALNGINDKHAMFG